MSTLDRMQQACAKVGTSASRRGAFIEACADVADEMVANVERLQGLDLQTLAKEMRANSERWFPELHNGSVPLAPFYALGLAGEAGETANVMKKVWRKRDGDLSKLGAEMSDVFVYLLLLADEEGIDLLAEYEKKVTYNEQRWGDAQ